jgi:hypothetical protein
MARRTSPDGDGDRQCERDDDRAEVEPDPISLFVLGKHEKLDHHPQTPRDSQSKPDQIAGSLVYGQMDSLWGLLMRAVTATSAPINSARRTMASIRSPIGMVDAGVPTSGGPGCRGSALMAPLICPTVPRRV